MSGDPSLLVGNVNFNNILFIDYSTEQVQIGTGTPNQALTVNGNCYISNDLEVGGNGLFDQNITVYGNANFLGNALISNAYFTTNVVMEDNLFVVGNTGLGQLTANVSADIYGTYKQKLTDGTTEAFYITSNIGGLGATTAGNFVKIGSLIGLQESGGTYKTVDAKWTFFAKVQNESRAQQVILLRVAGNSYVWTTLFPNDKNIFYFSSYAIGGGSPLFTNIYLVRTSSGGAPPGAQTTAEDFDIYVELDQSNTESFFFNLDYTESETGVLAPLYDIDGADISPIATNFSATQTLDLIGSLTVAGNPDERIAIYHDGVQGGMFSYNYASSTSMPLALQTPGGNVGIGITNPVGKLNILTGTSGSTIDLASQESGSISFVNSSGSTQPSIVGKNTTVNFPGMYFIAGTDDTNSNVDMRFDVRKNDNTDFSDTTTRAFQFSRFDSIDLLTILRKGDVGIGITNPSTRLHLSKPTANNYLRIDNYTSYEGGIVFGVNQGGASNIIYFYTPTDASSKLLVNDGGDFVCFDGSNQRLGVGTTSPDKELHVVGNFKVSQGLSELETFDNSDGIILRSNGGLSTDDCVGMVAPGTGSLNYGGNGSIGIKLTPGGSTANAGRFDVVHDGTEGLSYIGGNVGIGITNPSTKLYVDGGNLSVRNTSNPSINISDNGSGTELNLNYNAGASPAATWQWGVNDGVSNRNLRAYLSGTGEVFSITTGGRVGIGTTNPAYTFDIIGTGRASNALRTNTLLNDDTGNNMVFSDTVSDFIFYYGRDANARLWLGGTVQTSNFHDVFNGGSHIFRISSAASGSLNTSVTIGGTGTTTKLNVYEPTSIAAGSSQTIAIFDGNKSVWNDTTYIGIDIGSSVWKWQINSTRNSGTSNWDLRFLDDGGTNRFNIGGDGTVNIPGTLTKGAGTFDIVHPLNSQKRLIHSFVEAPRTDLIYRNRVQLVNGHATVNIDTNSTENGEQMTPGTFEALCRNPQIYLQNNESWDKVRGSIQGATLTIECESATSNVWIDWLVIAERKDKVIQDWDRTNKDGYLILERDNE